MRYITLGHFSLCLAILFFESGCGTDHSVFSRLPLDIPSQTEKAPDFPQPKTEAAKPSVLFLSDFQEAVQTADREFKPLFVFFSLPNCVNSQKMAETTFRNDEVQRLAQRFVCVRVDASAESGLCERLKVDGFPTILFLSPQGVELQRLAGKQTPDQLAVQMHVAIQSTAAKLGNVTRK